MYLATHPSALQRVLLPVSAHFQQLAGHSTNINHATRSIFSKIFNGLLFEWILWMCMRYLKFISLPIPEITEGTQKIWAVPGYAHAPFSPTFGLLFEWTLWIMCMPNLKFVALPIPEITGGTQKIGAVPGYAHDPFSPGSRQVWMDSLAVPGKEKRKQKSKTKISTEMTKSVLIAQNFLQFTLQLVVYRKQPVNWTYLKPAPVLIPYALLCFNNLRPYHWLMSTNYFRSCCRPYLF